MIRELATFILGRGITIAKFLTSGCIAAAVDFSLLFSLTHYIGVHYLMSSAVAFVAATVVGFMLQKFWTFRDASMSSVQRQAIQYVGLGLGNLGVNTVFMYLLVEYLNLWYLLSQVIVCGALACNNFILYSLCMFKKQSHMDRCVSMVTSEMTKVD